MINRRTVYAAVLFFNLIRPVEATEDPSLTIVIGKAEQTITKTELAKRLMPAEITVYSPVYQRPMTYQGFWLDDILSTFHAAIPEDGDIAFQSTDGYGTSMTAHELGRQKWLVAYGQPEGWAPLPERKMRTLPGPWYVVGRESSSYREFPWPYQVTAIKIRGEW